MTDDQLREFHLDGKQLVFLVISGIGVAVVVFLCGVMVGRGVPASASDDASNAEAALAVPADDDLLALGGASAATRDTRLPTDSAYPNRPSAAAAPEPLGDPVPTQAGPVAPVPAATASKAPAPVATTSTASSKGKFEVQVMSLKGRNEAEAVVRSLKNKGYSAFVSESFEGGHRYRVRVGGFADRGEATAAANRLAKEENYGNPWVDRPR